MGINQSSAHANEAKGSDKNIFVSLSNQQKQQQKRIEWMWKSKINQYLKSQTSNWSSYSDVETAIIEEAFQMKSLVVYLDDYHIDFERMLQISNNNKNKHRPVKRIVKKRNDVKLRRDRFVTNPISSSNRFTWSCDSSSLNNIEKYFTCKHSGFSTTDTRWCQMLVRQAAEGLARERIYIHKQKAKGLVIEGINAGKQKEGEWLSKELLKVSESSREEIYIMCARLYCMESFLYTEMDEYMKLIGDPEHENLWRSKTPTFGSFALLLCKLRDRGPIDYETSIVYRVAKLSDYTIEQLRKNAEQTHDYNYSFDAFPAFTSTTRNKKKAEAFGNVLFVIHISTGTTWGADVSSFSKYDEEEFLLRPNFQFCVKSCTFNNKKKKWIIHLQTPNYYTD